jgi:hypothetical protein
MLAALLLLFASAFSVIAVPTTGSFTSNATAFDLDLGLTKRQVNSRYVWTVFTDNSESNLYVYTSSDATTWSLLAGPTYTPPTGLIRDPSVLYHTE